MIMIHVICNINVHVIQYRSYRQYDDPFNLMVIEKKKKDNLVPVKKPM